jgi:hypothetical protein
VVDEQRPCVLPHKQSAVPAHGHDGAIGVVGGNLRRETLGALLKRPERENHRRTHAGLSRHTPTHKDTHTHAHTHTHTPNLGQQGRHRNGAARDARDVTGGTQVGQAGASAQETSPRRHLGGCVAVLVLILTVGGRGHWVAHRRAGSTCSTQTGVCPVSSSARRMKAHGRGHCAHRLARSTHTYDRLRRCLRCKHRPPL